MGKRPFRGNQGKTMYPRSRTASKEMRELTRQHALLEKNLKIDGMPDPPKFRKRRLSLNSATGRPHDKDATFKRKRLASVDSRARRDHMPKWELMGGDANDPLNLNGLAHSEEGRLLNLKTPESSPLPTPDFRKIVYVKVPPNIEDPLNLEGKHDQKEIDRLLNATIKKRHRSKKKKHDDSHQASSMPSTSTTAADSAETSSAADSVAKAGSEKEESDPAETDSSKTRATETSSSTPVKASAFGGRGRSRSRSLSMSPERRFKRQLSGNKAKGSLSAEMKQIKFAQNPKFTLGNYNRYYGYRNRDHEPDPRLQYFDPAWFKGKDVLDIGCNVGHITLALAEQYYPHKILGMDIDGKLIQAARQNIRHMLSLRRKDSSKYPRVFEMTRGPLEAHPLMGSSDQFPNNVLFLQGNYVPGSEEILKLQKEEYDTILALSITKWIHLNNGDNGLKLFFQKIFRQLRPGGRLILEPQPWSTYRKRAKLSKELFAKYHSIKLKPEGFKHYLLSIGFVKCEVIGVPVTKAKGFRRPLILFTKPDNKLTPSVLSNEEVDYRNVCQECGNTDKTQCDHPQFTGMRRGPYASHLYDHVNYPAFHQSDSPYFSSQRSYPPFGSSFNLSSSEEGGLYPHASNSSLLGAGGMWRVVDFSGEIRDNSAMINYRNDVNWRSSSDRGGVIGAESRSGSSRSQSGSVSVSGSESHSSSGTGSERSCSTSGTGQSSRSGSTYSSSASYYSPEVNGPNGDANMEGDGDYSPNQNGPNGDIANGFSPNPLELGLNGDIDDDIHFSPNPHGPNGDLVDDVEFSPNGNGQNGEILGEDDEHSPNPNNNIIADDIIGADDSPNHEGLNGDIINDVVWDEDDVDNAGVAIAAADADLDNSYSPVQDEVNGGFDAGAVQHWDDDNQDANMDAPLQLQNLPQGQNDAGAFDDGGGGGDNL